MPDVPGWIFRATHELLHVLDLPKYCALNFKLDVVRRAHVVVPAFVSPSEVRFRTYSLKRMVNRHLAPYQLRHVGASPRAALEEQLLDTVVNLLQRPLVLCSRHGVGRFHVIADGPLQRDHAAVRREEEGDAG